MQQVTPRRVASIAATTVAAATSLVLTFGSPASAKRRWAGAADQRRFARKSVRMRLVASGAFSGIQ